MELEKRMLALQIFDYLFQFVCEIIPELEKDGIPKEYMPQSRFRNVSNLPLNQYGKGPFCRFKITHAFRKTGAYLVVINGTPKYVGECEDFGKRWNMGYGVISPRKCYKGGQSTNCRINNLVLGAFKSGDKVNLFFHETNNRFEVEDDLIERLDPEWNTKGTGRPRKRQVQPISEKINLNSSKESGRNKYQKLEEYLRNSPKQIENLTYEDIERIIGTKLPSSAYKYRAWWSNSGQPHAKTWSNVNWKVSSANIGKSVTFKNIINKNNVVKPA
ncbi:GIY-YIG nuclease family protein [Candidatus Bathyarchaeota archaeon]|nr:GIY-YIG nuclease family protein [Candidatus Bathyarchaeota archaeon]